MNAIGKQDSVKFVLHKLVKLLAYQNTSRWQSMLRHYFNTISYFCVYALNAPLYILEAVNRLFTVPGKCINQLNLFTYA